MPQLRAVLVFLVLGGLSACVSPEPPVADHAFVGRWDCGVAVFTFTNTTYDNGSETLPIKAVEQDGRNYKLYFADGTLIGLGAVTDTGLTWVSGTSGDQFNCRRVN